MRLETVAHHRDEIGAVVVTSLDVEGSQQFSGTLQQIDWERVFDHQTPKGAPLRIGAALCDRMRGRRLTLNAHVDRAAALDERLGVGFVDSGDRAV
jgi:hypothetical protein